jgi:opine dehydrogenase
MKIVILGGGAGACAAAADLKIRGFDSILCSTYPADIAERIGPIRKKGGLEYSGSIGEGFAEIETSTDISCVKDADIVMIITLAEGYEYYARALARGLKKRQHIHLNPGYIGGILRFVSVLREEGVKEIPLMSETNNLAYACRIIEPTLVRVYQKAKYLICAGFPGALSEEASAKIREIYPVVKTAANVLETGMMNPNIIIHPAGMVANAGWIETTKGNFHYYIDGNSPSVSKLIEEVDKERVSLCKVANIWTLPFLDFYFQAGYTTVADKGVYVAFQNSEPNKTLKAPPSLTHRYLDEDVGYGMVPISCIARIAGTKVPTIDSIIHLSSVLRGVDYWSEGLTAKKMGLSGMTIKELSKYVESGVLA